MKIKKIFGPTLQGEGTHAGLKVMFVRFAGCNRWSGREKDRAKSICHFCDTDFVGGQEMSEEEVADTLMAMSSCRHVVLSGGEPCLQITNGFLEYLFDKGFNIHLETNGSVYMSREKRRCLYHISMSPKQGVTETNLTFCDDLKILYPFIDPLITPEKFKNFYHKNMWLQPIDEAPEGHPDKTTINYQGARNYVLSSDLHSLRLGGQNHKLWGVE